MLRVALCQINTTVGAFDANVAKVLDFVRRAIEAKAQLAVFPELCLSSYPPLDLLDRPDFLEANEKALEKLKDGLARLKAPAGFTVIFGTIARNPNKQGRPIQNTAFIWNNGEFVFRQSKTLLPTYDVFDELRYFEPAKKIELWDSPFGKLGIAVCEDAWFEGEHQGRRLYERDPALALKGADLVVNIAASPFEMNKRVARRELLARFVSRVGASMIYVNMVGGNDEILFDGTSQVYAENGKVLYQARSFHEEMAIVDLDLKNQTIQAPASELGTAPGELEILYEGLVTGIRDYFHKTGFKKAVLGLSGGIDSAVVACVAADALGEENVLGVAMPSQYSSPHSLADAESLAKAAGIGFQVLPIKFAFSTLLMELKPTFRGAPPDVTEENMQARLRALMLMALANKRGALLLTTGNKSELAVGYCTTYGDMAGALAPIGDVYKTRVYELAKIANTRKFRIPESTLTKAPSAELRPNQTDQDTLPSYEVLDSILERHIEGMLGESAILESGLLGISGIDPKTVRQVLELVRGSEFKRRQAAPVLKVSSKAFGLGRRIPIAKA